jgi:hypothetical protein
MNVLEKLTALKGRLSDKMKDIMLYSVLNERHCYTVSEEHTASIFTVELRKY